MGTRTHTFTTSQLYLGLGAAFSLHFGFNDVKGKNRKRKLCIQAIKVGKYTERKRTSFNESMREGAHTRSIEKRNDEEKKPTTIHRFPSDE